MGPAAMLPVLRVGAPMWAFRPWVGTFLPAGTRHGHELAAYAAILSAVEGNTTFYASPPATTVARWAEQAPPDFRFVFKVPREITHERRLRDVQRPIGEFVDLLAPLADRIGALSIQLPASFGPNDLGALAGLVRSLPRGVHWCVEVRHPGLFDGAPLRTLERILGENDVERVQFDTATLFAAPPSSDGEREAWRVKPRVPVLVEALTDRPVIRYIGRDDPDATRGGWSRWVDACERWVGEGRSPIVFVHTPDNHLAPGLAREFHEAVRTRLPDLPALGPLPPHEPDGGGEQQAQPSLF